MLQRNGDNAMTYELKPIKTLTVVAFVLHIASVLLMAAIIILQVPIKTMFWLSHSSRDAMFIMPSMIYVATAAIIFVSHGVLALIFIKVMASEQICIRRLNIVSIISVVFVAVLRPVIDNISQHFNMRFVIWGAGADEIAEIITTMNLLSYGLAIRNFSLLVFLIGASMALYFCHVRKIELFQSRLT